MKVILNIGFVLILAFCLQACGQEVKQSEKENQSDMTFDTLKRQESFEIINPKGTTIQTRILPPLGFQRTKQHDSSFATYLRQLPLKPHGSEVTLYNGEVKPNLMFMAVVICQSGIKICINVPMPLCDSERNIYGSVNYTIKYISISPMVFVLITRNG